MSCILNILTQCTITSKKQIHDIQQKQNVVKKKHDAIYSTLRSSRDIKLTVQRQGKNIELELTKDESGKFGFEITRTSDCLTVSQSNNAKLHIGDRIINAVSKTAQQEALFKTLESQIHNKIELHNEKMLDHEEFMKLVKKRMLDHQKFNVEVEKLKVEVVKLNLRHNISTSSHNLGSLGQQQPGAHGLQSGTLFSPPVGPQPVAS